MAETLTTRKRIQSIDLLRGTVMVLMALDHVRDYFHYDAFFFDPTDLTQTYPALFWTRFITHYCAPVFVLLAGTSAFMVGQKKDKTSLSIWLLKRGFWLIFVELTIVKFAWFFQLDYASLIVMVIWALGISMIVLAGFVHLPKKLGITICLLFIFGHNLFDGYAPDGKTAHAIWMLLHEQSIFELGSFGIVFVGYPIIPWIFVMPLGYYLGDLYSKDAIPSKRKKTLLTLGFSSIALFVMLRSFDLYGDANHWETQKTFGLSLASFFNVIKYPPSLQYLLITLGPALVFLAAAENWKGKFLDKLVVIGRVPMFFYVIHLYVIHLAALVAVLITGFPAETMVIDLWVTMQESLRGYGFSLVWVWIIWIAIVIALYPLCSWYNTYKSNHRDKWWLSYF